MTWKCAIFWLAGGRIVTQFNLRVGEGGGWRVGRGRGWRNTGSRWRTVCTSFISIYSEWWWEAEETDRKKRRRRRRKRRRRSGFRLTWKRPTANPPTHLSLFQCNAIQFNFTFNLNSSLIQLLNRWINQSWNCTILPLRKSIRFIEKGQ